MREYKGDNPMDAPDRCVPERFRRCLHLGRHCIYCGAVEHRARKECPDYNQRIAAEGPPRQWRSRVCKYPPCPDPHTHHTRVCPELHSRCRTCGRRGHSTSRCPGPESRFEDRKDYDRWAPEGVRLRYLIGSRHWEYEGTPDFLSALLPVNVDPWGTVFVPEDQHGDLSLEEDLKVRQEKLRCIFYPDGIPHGLVE